MSLLHLPLQSVTEAELMRLIDDRIYESRDIEYKQQSYADTEEAKAEWLADISSFANTASGDIVIGMAAEGGLANRITPLTLDIDAEKLRLEQIARMGLQPRLSNLEFHSISIKEGGSVLVARVGRSFNPPHRIVKSGRRQNQFWARSSADKFEPNVEELRSLFTLAPQLGDKIQAFRQERIAKITGQMTPAPLMSKECLVVQVVPLSSLAPGNFINLAQVNTNPDPFAPFSNRAQKWLVNFNGVLITSNAAAKAPQQRAYTQLYRSGVIEAIVSNIAGGERPQGKPPRLTTLMLEGMLLPTLTRFLWGLNALSVTPPYVVLVSLLGVKGVRLNVGDNSAWPDDDLVDLTDDQLHFTDVLMQSVPHTPQECAVMLRPILEQLANTAGQPVSRSFGPDGRYSGQF